MPELRNRFLNVFRRWNLTYYFDLAINSQGGCEHNAEFHYLIDVGNFFDFIFNAQSLSSSFYVFCELFAFGTSRSKNLQFFHIGFSCKLLFV